MSSTPDPLGYFEPLIQVVLRLARSAPTGQIVLARLGQTLDPLWIPRRARDAVMAELDAAGAAACEPLGATEVERALRAAWGSRPTDELDDLDLEPVAVTPTAQIHRGMLDGSPVAVKLLRPGLAAAVRQDLALLDGLVGPLALALPRLDARALMAELRERALEELDLESEAEAQRRFHRALRGHPFLTVPAPVMRLATEGVLVSGWVDGVSIAHAADGDRAAAQMVIFVLGSARWGSVQADPHIDDVLVLPDGGLALLDFGLTSAVEPGRVAAVAEALDAFAAGDADAFGRAAETLGWLPADHADAALELAHRVLGELAAAGTVRLDAAAVVGIRDRLAAQPDALARLVSAGALPARDLWLARAVAQLFGVVARVGASAPWIELARAALRDGWNAPLP